MEQCWRWAFATGRQAAAACRVLAATSDFNKIMSSAAPPPSKGMSLIAAYRSERLSQRPLLRKSLRESHKALHAERLSTQPEPACGIAEPHAHTLAQTALASRPATTGSVFANLVDVDAAERRHAAVEACQPPTVMADDPPATDLERPPGTQMAAITVTAVDPLCQTTQTTPRDSALAKAPSPEGPNSQSAAPQTLAETLSDGVQPSVDDPPLAEIGLGPGMIIRLSQLGVHSRTDLANADAGKLRDALGEISRLVDVESWIKHARSA